MKKIMIAKLFIYLVLIIYTITTANATVCNAVQASINYWNPYATNIGDTASLQLEVQDFSSWENIVLTFDIKHVTDQGVEQKSIDIPTKISYKETQKSPNEPCMANGACSDKCPIVVYIPIKVTGEGIFQVRFKAHISLVDGKTVALNDWGKDLNFSVFAFNEKFGMGEDPLAAMIVVARDQMTQENNELSELIIKDSKQMMAYYNRDLEEYNRIKKLNNIPTPTQHHINGSIYKRAQQLQQEYYLKHPSLESIK